MQTPITLIKTIDYNLIWDAFKDFYVLIESSNELEAYAINTYPNLAYFVDFGLNFGYSSSYFC